jgi:hypothetical protein
MKHTAHHGLRAIATAMRWSVCMLWVCLIVGSATAAFALTDANSFLQERPQECDVGVAPAVTTQDVWSPNGPAASMMRDASLMDDAQRARLLELLRDADPQGCGDGDAALCAPEDDAQASADDVDLWDPMPPTATLSEEAFRALGETRAACMLTSSPDQCEPQPPLPSQLSLDVATPSALHSGSPAAPRGHPEPARAHTTRVRAWAPLQIGASDGHGRLPETPPRG